ncbi:MAG TPA: entericidin A/B family lipoprotein [Rickettsiales bacterium]|nr:entericidin A/B family lipoprotein [Rickettsiales bacterium]
MKRFAMAVVLFLPLLTAACNTMEGAGKDISKGGQKLEDSAQQNKHY